MCTDVFLVPGVTLVPCNHIACYKCGCRMADKHCPACGVRCTGRLATAQELQEEDDLGQWPPFEQAKRAGEGAQQESVNAPAGSSGAQQEANAPGGSSGAQESANAPTEASAPGGSSGAQPTEANEMIIMGEESIMIIVHNDPKMEAWSEWAGQWVGVMIDMFGTGPEPPQGTFFPYPEASARAE